MYLTPRVSLATWIACRNVFGSSPRGIPTLGSVNLDAVDEVSMSMGWEPQQWDRVTYGGRFRFGELVPGGNKSGCEGVCRT